MPVLPNSVYNGLKLTATVVLPGLATLYLALVGLWHFPAGEQVVGTITAVNVFLGGILHLSTASYNASNAKYDGVMQVDEKADGTKTHNLVLWGDPSGLSDKKAISFKVEPSTPPTNPPSS